MAAAAPTMLPDPSEGGSIEAVAGATRIWLGSGRVMSDRTRVDVDLGAQVKDLLCFIRARMDVNKPIHVAKDRYNANEGKFYDPEATLAACGLTTDSEVFPVHVQSMVVDYSAWPVGTPVEAHVHWHPDTNEPGWFAGWVTEVEEGGTSLRCPNGSVTVTGWMKSGSSGMLTSESETVVPDETGIAARLRPWAVPTDPPAGCEFAIGDAVEVLRYKRGGDGTPEVGTVGTVSGYIGAAVVVDVGPEVTQATLPGTLMNDVHKWAGPVSKDRGGKMVPLLRVPGSGGGAAGEGCCVIQ